MADCRDNVKPEEIRIPYDLPELKGYLPVYISAVRERVEDSHQLGTATAHGVHVGNRIMQREVDIDLPVILGEGWQSQEHGIPDERTGNEGEDDDDCLHVYSGVHDIEEDWQLDIENIVNTGPAGGQLMQVEKGNGNEAKDSKEYPGHEGYFDRPPEVLLKGHPRPGGHNIRMQAVVPERIAVYPFQHMVPDTHWIT